MYDFLLFNLVSKYFNADFKWLLNNVSWIKTFNKSTAAKGKVTPIYIYVQFKLNEFNK